MTTIEQLVGTTAQHYEIIKRIDNGTLDAVLVRRGLQDIIEGKFKFSPPPWYVSPEEQLKRVKWLNEERDWGFRDIEFPAVPVDFSPRTSTEVLMLSIYVGWNQAGLMATCEELWKLIDLPGKSTAIKFNPEHLRHHPTYQYGRGLSWVAFDPSAYRGLSPTDAYSTAQADRAYLAGTEVLTAALLFPKWAKSLEGRDTSHPFPYLGNLQFRSEHDFNFRQVPALVVGALMSQLHTVESTFASVEYSSPTVRVC